MSKSFTLLELLIVIGILSAISVVVVIAVDPVEQLNKARDIKRMTELSQIRDAILIYISEGNTLPTTSTNSLSNNTNLDGTGWIPIDFTKITIGKPLPYLPLDPKNNSSYYYIFLSNGTNFELDCSLESKMYRDKMTNDGGDRSDRYEVGTKLALSGDVCEGGTATASNFTGGYGPEKAFDNNESTFWHDGSGSGNWIKYDFGIGNEKQIRKFRIKSYQGWSFNFQSSADNSTWNTLVSGSCGASQWAEFTFSNTESCQYYRIYGTAGDVAAAYEIEMMDVVEFP